MFLWRSVVDEQRSCAVTTSKSTTHIISSSFKQRICGTIYQPWLIEASVGQRIRIILFNFVKNNQTEAQKQTVGCYGTIIDKIGRGNISICANEFSRETTLYDSAGNVLSIIYSNPERDNNYFSGIFILKLIGKYAIWIYSSQNLYYAVYRQ